MAENEPACMSDHNKRVEKEQYCIAKHLQAFLQLTVNEDHYFILPCRVCKYFLDDACNVDRFDLMRRISEETGVELSFWKGFKNEEFSERSQR